MCWIALLILTGLRFNRERKASRREPGFIPPENTGGISSYANVYTGHIDEERYDAEPKPADEPTSHAPAAYDPPVNSSYGYTNEPAQMPVQDHRASVDPYGTADDRTSRTMQLAYSDPCELPHSTQENKAHEDQMPLSDRTLKRTTLIPRMISSPPRTRQHQLPIPNSQLLMRPVHPNMEGTDNSCSMYHSHLDVSIVTIQVPRGNRAEW